MLPQFSQYFFAGYHTIICFKQIKCNISETRSWIQNLRPDFKSLNKIGAPKFSLTFVMSDISETRSWIQNHRTLLHKQNKNAMSKVTHLLFTLPTLVWYEGPGVSRFA